MLAPHIRSETGLESLAPGEPSIDVDRLLADLVPLRDNCRRLAIRFPQDRHHLFVSNSRLAHGALFPQKAASQATVGPKTPGQVRETTASGKRT